MWTIVGLSNMVSASNYELSVLFTYLKGHLRSVLCIKINSVTIDNGFIVRFGLLSNNHELLVFSRFYLLTLTKYFK